jgi:hypothetical protein
MALGPTTPYIHLIERTRSAAVVTYRMQELAAWIHAIYLG